MEIITREHALALGLSRYFTGVACSRGNFHTRRASNGHCLCELCSKHRYNSRKEYYAKWVADNPEKARAPKLRYAAVVANIEKHREKNRARKRANPAKVAADTRWRQTIKQNATPWWVDAGHPGERELLEELQACLERLSTWGTRTGRNSDPTTSASNVGLVSWPIVARASQSRR